jgi:lipopolysaccharide export system protein LptC
MKNNNFRLILLTTIVLLFVIILYIVFYRNNQSNYKIQNNINNLSNTKNYEQFQAVNNTEIFDYEGKKDYQPFTDTINCVKLSQPGIYVIAKPNDNIDLTAIPGINHYNFVIRLRSRDLIRFDLKLNDYIEVAGENIMIIGNSNITKENPILVENNFEGLIENGLGNESKRASEIDNEYNKLKESYNDNIIKNIHLKNVNQSADSKVICGICRSHFGCKDGQVSTTEDFSTIRYNQEIDNCSFKGNIDLGGIVGNYCASNGGKVKITNCHVDGNIIGLQSGGICGFSTASHNGTVFINKCSYIGTIIGNNGGGICGENLCFKEGKSFITGCVSNAVIFGFYSGGICGVWCSKYGGNTKIKYCYSNGLILGSNSGGICGAYASNENNSELLIQNCYSKGEIRGVSSGGICGYHASSENGKLTIIECFSTGNITGFYAGGICGDNATRFKNGSINIYYCYSRGNIDGDYASGIITTGCTDSDNNFGILNISNCFTTGLLNGNYACSIFGGYINSFSSNACNSGLNLSIKNCLARQPTPSQEITSHSDDIYKYRIVSDKNNSDTSQNIYTFENNLVFNYTVEEKKFNDLAENTINIDVVTQGVQTTSVINSDEIWIKSNDFWKLKFESIIDDEVSNDDDVDSDNSINDSSTNNNSITVNQSFIDSLPELCKDIKFIDDDYNISRREIHKINICKNYCTLPDNEQQCSLKRFLNYLEFD